MSNFNFKISLAEHSPHLLKEWYYSNDIDPENVGYSSIKKVKWICSLCNEVYEQSIKNRTYFKYNHRFCKNRKKRNLTNENNLAFLYPKLTSQWSDKNENFPDKYPPFSRSKVWWKCENKHEWQSSIYHRTMNNTDCPYCVGKACNDNNITITNPELINSWNYNKNDKSPEELTFGSAYEAWWICHNKHEWKQIVNSRIANYNNGCPICNSIVITHHELIKEWDYIKNKENPESFTFGSQIEIWWKCDKNHEWKARISSRTKGSNCPFCMKCHISKLETEWLDSFNNINIKRQFKIKLNNKKFKLDGFDMFTNTVYEFHGDYWHGNPKFYDSNDINMVAKKNFGQLYNETLKKEKLIKEGGYNLIIMWESDWKLLKNQDNTNV